MDWLLDRARLIGPQSGTWAELMIKNRGPQGIRVLQGFLQLAAKHAPANIEAASQLASTHGVWHLSDIRSLLHSPTGQDQFQFIQQHPIIRDLSHYQALIPDCFGPTTDNHPTTESNYEPPSPQSNLETTAPVRAYANAASPAPGSGGEPTEPL
jgi:hypothetical protein